MKRDRFATLRGAIEGPLQRAVIALSRLKRGMTLGVRALVIDPERRIFLVKHSYVSGWQLPGDTTAPTRARIIEVVGGVPIPEYW